MDNLLKIFNFLWRLKRVQHYLSSSWGQNMSNFNNFTQIPGMKNKFHLFNLYHNEMAHFVANVHNYIMVEVLESAWKIYQDEVKQAKDLDELIDIQHKFVQGMLNKALLNEEQKELHRLLRRIQYQVFTFVLIKEKYFYPSAIDEFKRIQALKRRREQGLTDHDMEGDEDEDIEDLKQPQINVQCIEQMENIYMDFT